MEESDSPRLRALVGRRASAILAVSLLLLTNPGLLPEHHSTSLHGGLAEPATLNGSTSLFGDLVFYNTPGNSAPTYILATAAADEPLSHFSGKKPPAQATPVPSSRALHGLFIAPSGFFTATAQPLGNL
ncbi:MAG: hypothetical protein IIB33_05410 [Chloroflexi bacterium]|nr:hypothetical protein [Chloroflexota bacterium]